MTNLQRALVGGLLVTAILIAAYYFRQTSALSKEVENLQRDKATSQFLSLEREPAAKPSIDPEPESTMRELLRLRNEVGLLRQQTNELARRLQQQVQGANRITTEPGMRTQAMHRDALAFAGFATPEAALQSYAWAVSRGDLQAYLSCLSPEERQTAAEQLGGKSDLEIRNMLLGRFSAQALRPDRQRVLEDGAVEFTTFSTEVDDGLTISKSETVVRFRNLSGEWKVGR